ncbi:MAG: SBBP repeat-containing protein [Phycisphaerales bacterium]|nr:MAG: SBBP repeat-containing protein [Phycisphaerales bacterium]
MRVFTLTISLALSVVLTLPGSLLAQTFSEEWVARYDGPGNLTDSAAAMAVDASGNVYVTGTSDGGGTYGDYATVKYDSSGTALWVARYNGPRSDQDKANAIAVDASGDVYVTGVSGTGIYGDYATVKYDSSGNELWVARYNGLGNGQDNARAIALDASGNVYVTGWTNISVSDFDYATIKYDASGNELWVARYDDPAHDYDWAYALAVDASGNVYVTGRSLGYGTVDDCVTIKYDSDGTEIWVARYDGPANSNDAPSAMTVDASGNVYVTGYTWSIATNLDYVTVKYDSAGTELWAAIYDGPESHYDEPQAIAVDASGNVYVTGYSYSSTLHDYATVKYDSSGTELWAATYNGPADDTDWADAIAVDASGNVYVTGRSVGSGTADDYATVQYDSSGNELWVGRFDGPAHGTDQASAVALDASGNVYVTGGSFGDGTDLDYATIKYVQDPAAAIEALIAAVISLNLQPGIETSLISLLNEAQRALDDPNATNDIAAINALEAFISVVEALSGVFIPVDDANALIAAAQQIIDLLNAT